METSVEGVCVQVEGSECENMNPNLNKRFCSGFAWGRGGGAEGPNGTPAFKACMQQAEAVAALKRD